MHFGGLALGLAAEAHLVAFEGLVFAAFAHERGNHYHNLQGQENQ